jgi:hypothetical protein
LGLQDNLSSLDGQSANWRLLIALNMRLLIKPCGYRKYGNAAFLGTGVFLVCFVSGYHVALAYVPKSLYM